MPKMPIKSSKGLNFSADTSTQTLFQTAISFHRQGDIERAQRAYERILTMAPRHFDATHLLAVAIAQRGDTDRARGLFARALTLRPGHGDVHFNRGTMERDAGNDAAAIRDFDIVLGTTPDHAGALNNRCLSLQAMRRFDAAILDSDRLISLTPQDPVVWNNRGNLLLDCMRPDEALACLDEALRLHSEYHEAFNNRGNILKELQKFDQALADYDRAIAIAPDFGDAHFNKAMLLLLQGDFENGWHLWEWRWKQTDFSSPQRDFQVPQWTGGMDISGKTLLLHSEQGLGDTIQFIRFAPLAADLGARVIVEAPTVLHPLLGTVQGIDHLVGKNTRLPEFDLHCPLMSLPLAMGTTLETVPLPGSYITASASLTKTWARHLGNTTKPRLALAWRGNPNNTDDHNRSMRLSDIAPYLNAEYEWLCLHHDLDSDEKRLAATMPHLATPLDGDTGLEDAAALCALADIVVTVDTSFAHIAGALGRPTFVMLRYTPDFRWMMNRGDTPWYEEMTLFRQTTRGDWQPVLRNLTAALHKLFT